MTEIMSRESLCIKIPKTQGEKALRLAHKLGVSDKELKIEKNASSIYIPLFRQPSEKETAALRAQLPHFLLEAYTFSEKKLPNTTLTATLENQLPSNILANLPRALDIVGDIAIVEVPPELKQYERTIGKAILENHRGIRTVLAKVGAISGTYRLREFAVIAGEQRTSTVYKEFGCKYRVDVAKAYFSPRLSHEHKRVASLVQKGETIVDMFAGVGPFSVLMAKNNLDVKVYAIDINPEAIRLLETNVRLNRVENRVFPILGDATKVVEERLFGIADRTIMNLPENAIEFVDAACRAIKSSGGTVHFYGFVRLPDTLQKLQRLFSEAVEKAGRKADKFLLARTVRETAPYECQVALDARIL